MKTLFLAAMMSLGALGCAGGHAVAPAPVAMPLRATGIAAELEQVTPRSPGATVTVSFHNQTSRNLRVVRYRLSWPGGSVVVTPAALDVPASTSMEALLHLGPEAGDLYALYDAPMGARVVVLEVR